MKIKSKEDTQHYWGPYASKEARRERFLRLYDLYLNEGLTLQQIADQEGISKQRVHQVLVHEAKEPELAEIKKRADIVQRNSWRVKEIENLLTAGNSCAQVAKILNISVNTVKRVSAKFNKRLKCEAVS